MHRLPALGVGLVLMTSVSLAADSDWIDLLVSGEKTPWKSVDAKWIFATDAGLTTDMPKKLSAKEPGKSGPVWVNGPGRLPDLYTKDQFGDCEIHVEFLIAKGSNAGVKFQGVYEVQILDSFGKKDADLTGDDCGGIYPRAETSPKYHHIDKGIAPKTNAAKPAGEWQTLEVIWNSPRFDSEGKKTANAKIVKATLNGKVIHENQELLTPTGNNHSKKETAKGPLMLQADHGPVAFRNVKIKSMK